MRVDVHKCTDRGDVLTVLEPIEIEFEGRRFTVPAGFESDGVSTPRFLWATISPAIDPRTIRAGVAHDYLYRFQPAGWSRRDADKMFYALAREDGLRWFPALKAYLGLRLFGGVAWEIDRREKEGRYDD